MIYKQRASATLNGLRALKWPLDCGGQVIVEALILLAVILLFMTVSINICRNGMIENHKLRLTVKGSHV